MTKKSLASLFFSLLLASCARTEMPSSKPSSGNMVPYPASAVQNFMNSCTKSDSQASCSCTIDKIQNRYSLEEFTLIAKKVSVNEQNLPDEIMDFGEKCSKENPTPTGNNNLPNSRENPKPPSSVSYYEKLKRYLPDEGRKVVYRYYGEKKDDVIFYVVINREIIPQIPTVSVLEHKRDTDICRQLFSFHLTEDGVYSLVGNKEDTPEELSRKSEMAYQALESGVIIAHQKLLSCKRGPSYLEGKYSGTRTKESQ
jgi:hypothetical protein